MTVSRLHQASSDDVGPQRKRCTADAFGRRLRPRRCAPANGTRVALRTRRTTPWMSSMDQACGRNTRSRAAPKAAVSCTRLDSPSSYSRLRAAPERFWQLTPARVPARVRWRDDSQSGRALTDSRGACKQRCYRARHTTPHGAKVGTHTPKRVRTDRVLHSVSECPSCGERFVGLRRCPDCNLFLANLGLGGACDHCDEPLLLTELLGEGGVTLLD